jgi:asparagine synthase (glutamine-hydrolysing)
VCGIAGFVDLGGRTQRDPDALVLDIVGQLAHRGPDADGTWIDSDAGIALGHRRLSIVDLSDAGAQPMHSASERYVISYNGEIYNAPDLAQELESAGHHLKGHCDTEVLIEAIDAWGLDRALAKTNGMFAFALWDRRERRLHLVRDRLGEKPLYYGWIGDTFLFGSELKALRAHPAFRPEIDRDALAMYFRYSCILPPFSIYRGVRKLVPGTILTIDPANRPRDTRPVPYWSAVDAFTRQDDRRWTDEEATDAIEELLLDATKMRMRSDVPLGAFLSGGLDSSVVVALMQAQSDRSVRTFTIGSPDRIYNEADRAAAIADHLGTRHTELMVTGADALAVVPKLGRIYDEPFADSSQIPTLLVSELARHDVTVSLSGDGGDEVFGGYDRYRMVPSLAARLPRYPTSARTAAAAALRSVPPVAWTAATAAIPTRYRPRIPATKVSKLAQLLPLDRPEDMYRKLVSHWDDPEALVIGAEEVQRTDLPAWGVASDVVNEMMLRDTVGYLPGDILAKLDRATMSVSLEGRIPLLDHRVVELMASMPSSMKVRDGTTKYLLRRVLDRYVPPALTRSPKSGFGVPIGAWLRGPLRPWVEELLSADRLAREGYVQLEPIRRMWAEHLGRRRDWGYHLWDVLMFQAWLAEWTSI